MMADMRILSDSIAIDELAQMATKTFGNLVKAVVDVDREILALDAELHSDLEALLLEDGSNPGNLWGINFYPELTGEDFVEYDSMINVRPLAGNRTRGVDDPVVRERIMNIVAKRVRR
jgi:hypothetical protein